MGKFFNRFGILGLGVAINEILVWGFDYILYPFVIWKLGVWIGGFIMTVTSFVFCYILIRTYDWSKKDWLGIEAIKNFKKEGGSLLRRFVVKILEKGDCAIMIFLSIKFDPFITTLYMRHGAHEYNGMSKRDWRIFISSLILGNIFWIIVSLTGISFIELLLSKTTISI